ncbi:MAG: DUF4199 domain-containing protein [bacterium]
MNPTVKSIGLNYGLYLGAFFILTTGIIYAVDLDIFLNWWLRILFFVIAIGAGVVAAMKIRSELGGYISFKDAFTGFFLTMVVSTVLSTIVSIVLFVVIDPEAAQYLNEQVLVQTKEMMERWNTPQDVMVRELEKAREKDNFSVGNQSFGMLISFIFYAIFGLIVALIVKRKNPDEA